MVEKFFSFNKNATILTTLYRFFVTFALEKQKAGLSLLTVCQERKVRATQGILLPNGKLLATAE